MRVSFIVHGKVQGVMYRKSFCYGCFKRGLKAGATNLPDRSKVLCSVEGDEELINKLIDDLTGLKKINSWGAKVESVERVENFHEYSNHDYDNLDMKSGFSLMGVIVNI